MTKAIQTVIDSIVVVGVLTHCAGARGVMVIIVGNGHNDTSSNPGPGQLHFT